MCSCFWGYVEIKCDSRSLLLLICTNHAHVEFECYTHISRFHYRKVRLRPWLPLHCAKQWAWFVSNYDTTIDSTSTQIVYRIQMDFSSRFCFFFFSSSNKRCQINLTPCHHVFLEGLLSITRKNWEHDKFPTLEIWDSFTFSACCTFSSIFLSSVCSCWSQIEWKIALKL